MKISEYSRNRLRESMVDWQVARDFADPICDYLLYGYDPGSFFTSLLANDAMSAIARSHPANTITALKGLAGWINDRMPRVAWGSYDAVAAWLAMEDDARRAILEHRQLIYTPKEETWLALAGTKSIDEDPLVQL